MSDPTLSQDKYDDIASSLISFEVMFIHLSEGDELPMSLPWDRLKTRVPIMTEDVSQDDFSCQDDGLGVTEVRLELDAVAIVDGTCNFLVVGAAHDGLRPWRQALVVMEQHVSLRPWHRLNGQVTLNLTPHMALPHSNMMFHKSKLMVLDTSTQATVKLPPHPDTINTLPAVMPSLKPVQLSASLMPRRVAKKRGSSKVNSHDC